MGWGKAQVNLVVLGPTRLRAATAALAEGARRLGKGRSSPAHSDPSRQMERPGRAQEPAAPAVQADGEDLP